MSVVGELERALSDYPLLLTVEEAAGLLRVSRAHAYALVRRYFETDGHEGIPALRVGSCIRVPRWALAELLSTGRLVRLLDAVDDDEHVDDVTHLTATSRRSRRTHRQSRVVNLDRNARHDSAAVEQLALIPSD